MMMPTPAEIVLLIEDDLGTAELMRQKLDELGLETEHVTTGQAAVEWLRNPPLGKGVPRLLLLDQSLPDLSGLELVEQLSAAPGGMPPFIVTTGAGDERLAVSMMKRGAKDYLIKDRHFLDTLPVVVQHILKQLDTERQLADTEQALFESETRYRRVLEQAVEIEQVLAVSLDQQLIFETLAQGIQRLLPDISAVLFSKYDAERHVITAIYALHEGKPMAVVNFPEIPLAPPGQGTQSQVIHTRQPLIVASGLTKRLNPSTLVRIGLPEKDPQSALYIPMLAQEKVLGVIQIQSYTPDRFNENDAHLLSLLANTAASAIENARLYELAQSEIAERKRAEDALLESETKLRLIFEKSHDAIGVSKAGIHTLVNPAYVALFGFDCAEELVGVPILQIIAPESHDRVREYMRRRAFGEPIPTPYEVTALRKDGTSFIMEVTGSRYDLRGEAYTLVLLRDVTARKLAEEQLKITLQEREVLLRELYHRTKNNMQVMSAMLSLEAERTENENLQNTLRDMETRIRSMALVHQKLYQSKNLSSVDLKEYISDLAELLLQTYQTTPGQVKLALDIEPTPVVIDSAIPCGLIINETISNALKYAFPDERKGQIQIRIARMPEAMILLEISDDGVGIPPGVDLRQSATLGMQTIFGIAGHQLGAKVEVETTRGVCWRIQFSDNQYRPRV